MKRSLLNKILLFILPLCMAFGMLGCVGSGNSSTSKKESEETSSKESVLETENEQVSEESQSAEDGESTTESKSEVESEKESASESEEESESEPEEVEPLVDFIVEVEEGRDIRVLQLSDIQVLDGSQQRFQARIGTAWVGGGGPVSRY